MQTEKYIWETIIEKVQKDADKTFADELRVGYEVPYNNMRMFIFGDLEYEENEFWSGIEEATVSNIRAELYDDKDNLKDVILVDNVNASISCIL